MDKTETVRINRYLAMCGVSSRRDADVLIEAGRVLIAGEPAKKGDRVPADGSADVTVDGKEVKPAEASVVFAWYKPVGVTCTMRDEHADRTVETEMKDRPELSGLKNVRLSYAGRLDRDSEGLLILTNDGGLIRRLERAENGVEKEYLVTVNAPVTDSVLSEFEKGVYLEELDVTTRPCRTAREGGRSFRIILTEGKNRQIRRMCAACGLRVERLVRIREGRVRLDGMKPGELRRIGSDLFE